MPTFRSLLVAASLAATSLLPVLTIAHRAGAESAPLDVIRTKDGGLLRGTIESLDPKREVVIVLLSGERRTLSMSDVEFAGPASDDPRGRSTPTSATAPAQEVVVSAAPATLHFETSDGALTFHLKVGESSYAGASYADGRAIELGGVASTSQRLCTAPCEVALAAGEYRFGISQGAGKVVLAPPVSVNGDVVVRGVYRSRQDLRTVGLVTTIVGGAVVLGSFVGALSVSASSTAASTTDIEWAAGGIAAGVVITGVGVLLSSTSDTAAFTVTPVTRAAGVTFRPGVATAASPAHTLNFTVPPRAPTGVAGLSLVAAF
jgi:hypothetical protein